MAFDALARSERGDAAEWRWRLLDASPLVCLLGMRTGTVGSSSDRIIGVRGISLRMFERASAAGTGGVGGGRASGGT